MRFQPCKVSDIKVGAILGWKGSVPSLGRPRKYKITEVKWQDHQSCDMVLLRVDESDPQAGGSFSYPFDTRSISNDWYLMSAGGKEFTDEEYEELLV